MLCYRTEPKWEYPWCSFYCIVLQDWAKVRISMMFVYCVVLQDWAKVTISMMFILLYCVTGLSQSDNIHDVHFIVLCYRTEPKWQYSWCSFEYCVTWLSPASIAMFTVFMLCYRTEPSQYNNVHSVHAVCCVTELSPASIAMFTVFMLCAVLQNWAQPV